MVHGRALTCAQFSFGFGVLPPIPKCLAPVVLVCAGAVICFTAAEVPHGRVQDIRAVSGAVHPRRHDGCYRGLSRGNIFRAHPGAITREVTLTDNPCVGARSIAAGVAKEIVRCHIGCVDLCRVDQLGVQRQTHQTTPAALIIDSI